MTRMRGAAALRATGEGEVEGEEQVLFQRIASGDRAAAAAYIEANLERLERAATGVVSGPLRGMFDTQDLVSTVRRRLDEHVAARQVSPRREWDLWRTIEKLANAALVDYARVPETIEHMTDRDTAALIGRLTRDEPELSLGEALAHLGASPEREMLVLWLRGNNAGVIARLLGVSHERVRKRMQVIREELRGIIDERDRRPVDRGNRGPGAR